MAHYTRPSLAMLTHFFSDQNLEDAARQSGFVKRASKITGKIFFALMTFGLWGNAKTTLSQLAAKATVIDDALQVTPEALHQRMMNKSAAVFLKELMRQAFATLHQAGPITEGAALAPFEEVHLIDSTGFELPESLQNTFPGSAGSASKAGAKIQLSWAYLSSRFAHFALTPLNVPDSKYVDTIITLACPRALLIFDLGYFKLEAFAKIAAAKAFFVSRLHHWPVLFDSSGDCPSRLDVVDTLKTTKLTLLDLPILLGACDQIACRLVAVRLPDDVVNERRRKAKQQAQKKKRTLSKASLELLAWNLFITNVPVSLWRPQTVATVYRLRWQVELVFKSWKSSLHLASINTKKRASTLCYLYGRMLLLLIVYALSPAIRSALWVKQQRALSELKLVRHFHALADRWMLAIFQSELERYRFLARACVGAERLVGKASRKRRTTAQLIEESLDEHFELFDLDDLKMIVNA